MQYSQGKIGRVFVARIEHGDDLLAELKNLAEKENIEAAVFYVIGALKKASLVTGPEKCTRQPVPVWHNFDDCREIIGVGTLFRYNGRPALHLHGSTGKGGAVLTGCLRGETEVYLIAEVIILEVTGTGAVRKLDRESGLKMLSLKPQN